jgi:N-acetyl sugar amidotransferase
MIYCEICLQPNSRPGTKFINGLCPVCDFHRNSKKTDWIDRVETLKAQISKQKLKSVHPKYDSILGVSGGKDSTRQALWARDYLGLNPLLVAITYPPEQSTQIGVENLNNLANLGFDIYSSAPAPRVWKTLMRDSFINYGNWAKTTELALFSGVPQIALEMGINCILWGENPALQVGASETLSSNGWDGNSLRRLNTISGIQLGEYVNLGFSLEQLLPYEYPSELQFSNGDLQIIFLGWAIKDWGLAENALISALNGLVGREDSALNTSDLLGYSSIDEDWVIVNQMIKYYKFGFGRATEYVNEWIRKGLLERSRGVELVELYDGRCSDVYISSFCEYIEIDQNQFWERVRFFTNPELFDLSKRGRPKRKFVVGHNL